MNHGVEIKHAIVMLILSDLRRIPNQIAFRQCSLTILYLLRAICRYFFGIGLQALDLISLCNWF